jgi:hypothetical protein
LHQISHFLKTCILLFGVCALRSASVSICGNQALLNTIDPLEDDSNSTTSDKENSCEIKLQLDFNETASADMQNEENHKERIDDSVQVGYVSQVVAQMEGAVACKKSVPKPKTQQEKEVYVNSVKSLLSRLEHVKEPNPGGGKDGQNCTQVRQHVLKKQKNPMTQQCSGGEKVISGEGHVSSKGSELVILDQANTISIVRSLPHSSNTDELKKENERLLEENKNQRKQIEHLEAELKVVNEKLMKLYAEQFVQNRRSLDVKARMETKVKELEASVKVLNAQRLQEK